MTCQHEKKYVCAVCAPEVFNPTPEQAREYSVTKLTAMLREAKRAYYAGSPIMRDEEYDALENSLRAIDPTAPVLSEVGAEIIDINKNKAKVFQETTDKVFVSNKTLTKE